MPEVCPVCEETVLEGDLGVADGELDDGTFFVAVIETSPRNHIICDSCNRVVCHNCCTTPKVATATLVSRDTTFTTW